MCGIGPVNSMIHRYIVSWLPTGGEKNKPVTARYLKNWFYMVHIVQRSVEPSDERVNINFDDWRSGSVRKLAGLE